jgi:hypothetical protein
MDMLRVWPVICQFSIGAVLFGLGIWGGLKGGYLNLKVPEDRHLVALLTGGYLFLLIVSCVFTFLAPYWKTGGAL